MRKIAALFVHSNGVYSGWPWIELWDENKDARNYQGPYPVVAHPPCNLWGKFSEINYIRWGGEHNRPGNDGMKFLTALKNVKTYGGVLEHPAQSKAFEEYRLGKPVFGEWIPSRDGFGWITEVWQSAYGHKANKATWLYYRGINKPKDLKWEKVKGTHQIGYHDKRGKDANKPTVSRYEAIATPIEFRDELLRLAVMSRGWA